MSVDVQHNAKHSPVWLIAVTPPPPPVWAPMPVALMAVTSTPPWLPCLGPHCCHRHPSPWHPPWHPYLGLYGRVLYTSPLPGLWPCPLPVLLNAEPWSSCLRYCKVFMTGHQTRWPRWLRIRTRRRCASTTASWSPARSRCESATVLHVGGDFGSFILMLRPAGCSQKSQQIQGCQR